MSNLCCCAFTPPPSWLCHSFLLTATGSEISLKGLVSFSGYGPCLSLSMLSVCRRLIVSPKPNAPCGFLLLVFCHVCPLVLIVLAVVSFCTVPLCLWLTRGLMLVVATSNASFRSTISLFVFAVFMPLTVTLNVTSSLKTFPIKLILQSPPFLWVTSTLFLIGSRIVVGLTPLTTAVRVPSALLPFSTPAV